MLFKEYPLLKKAYPVVLEFRNIYEQQTKDKAQIVLENWLKRVSAFEENVFKTVINTIENNWETILNFFNNRNANANAESFNARIKLFRANQRGVTDTSFFLFRLEKLFA